jgi:hypothetical protein
MAEQRFSSLAPAHTDVEEDSEIGSDMGLDENELSNTPLDRTIDRIGMGELGWSLCEGCHV